MSNSDIPITGRLRTAIDTAWGQLSIDDLRDALDEIERLQARVEELERGVRSAVLSEKYKLVERIEELEKIVENQNDYVIVLPDGDAKLEINVFGSENHCERLSAYINKLESIHHITDKQIDAAWKFAHCFIGPARNNHFKLMLMLGIKRCEAPGCDHGTYTEGNDDGSQTCDRPCEVCGGHEWIKTSVDPNKDGQNGTDDG